MAEIKESYKPQEARDAQARISRARWVRRGFIATLLGITGIAGLSALNPQAFKDLTIGVGDGLKDLSTRFGDASKDLSSGAVADKLTAITRDPSGNGLSTTGKVIIGSVGAAAAGGVLLHGQLNTQEERDRKKIDSSIKV